MFKSILCPVDPHDPGFETRAVAAAVELAKAGGTMHLLSVIPEPLPAVDQYLPLDFFAGQKDSALAALDGLAARTGLPKTQIKAEIRVGRPHVEILEAAKAHHADIIVMSSHRPGLATYFMGSTAASVVRHATSSVMVIRPEE